MKLLASIILPILFFAHTDSKRYKGHTYVCFASHSAYLFEELQLTGKTFVLKNSFENYMLGVKSEIEYIGNWVQSSDSIILTKIQETNRAKTINKELLKELQIDFKAAEDMYSMGIEMISLKKGQTLHYIIKRDTLKKTFIGSGNLIDLILSPN